MLDEKQLRRPDFLAKTSVRVIFGDDQEWFVPKPVVYYTPSGEELGFDLEVESGDAEFDGSHGALLRAVKEIEEGESQANYYAAKLKLYANMLRRNYRLDDAQLRSLLRFRYGQPDELEQTLRSVALGLDGPKVSTVGGDWS